MSWAQGVRTRLLGWADRRQFESEMEDELRFHLRMQVQENIARGLAPAEAEQAARRTFGNVPLIKDEWRDAREIRVLGTLMRDLRFAARVLKKDRVLTCVAVCALALGVGANTALFTVISRVLLRPLPYPQAEELMAVWSSEGNSPSTRFKVSFPDFLDLREHNRTFESLGAYLPRSFIVSHNGGAASRVEGACVTSDIFPLLEGAPALGRAFSATDDEPGSRAVLVSERFWDEHLARAAGVTDAVLMIDGQPCPIIGVMPRSFRFPIQNQEAQIWMTFARDHEPFANGVAGYATHRDGHYLRLLGRLKQGATRAEAEADLNRVAADLAVTYPNTNKYFDACVVVPWLADLTSKVRPALVLLAAAAACLLCVACANIANLLLARASTRQKEIDIRAALGAGRRRIFRQLLTESLLLSLLGGAVGLLLAFAGTRLLVHLLPPDFPRAAEIMPDARMLAFGGMVALGTSCLFGFAPAWRSARSQLGRSLNDGSVGSSAPHRGRRLRNALVGTEIVLSLVLLACSLSLLQNLWSLQSAPLGFNPRSVLTAKLLLPEQSDDGEWTRLISFCDELLLRTRLLPGVVSASMVTNLPIGPQPIVDFRIAGRELSKADLPRAESRIVGPGYFRTMEIPVRCGREFDARDTRRAAPVVIINETLARRIFGREDPLGRRITPGLADNGAPVAREIIAVVGDVKADRFASGPESEIYVPLAQCVSTELSLVVRQDAAAPSALAEHVREIAHFLNRDVALYDLSTFEEQLDRGMAQPRLTSALLVAFALVAVILTAIGVYGVMAYSVAQRRHEIGIRLALGASRAAILRLIVGEGVRLILLAAATGSAASVLVLSRLRHLGYDSLGHTMPTTGVVTVLVAAVAFLACWLPARRAACADPLAVIRPR